VAGPRGLGVAGGAREKLRKLWPACAIRIKDPCMTRRSEMGRRHSAVAFVPVEGMPERAATSSRARRVGAGLLLASACILGVACQGERAPNVQSEPPREAVASPVAAAPSAAAPSAAAPSATAPLTAAPSAGAVPTPNTAGTAATPSAAPREGTGAVGLAKYEPPAEGAAVAGGTPVPSATPTADGPAKAAPGQPIQGAAITEEPFSIWLQAVSPIAAGSAATVEAVLVAKPPYHCNADYPHKFKLAAAPTGITYPETTVKGAKVTAEKSVLPIPVRAQSPGKAKVSGTLSFSVCNEERCLVEKRELALELEVK
jgi:hypothetical protein